MSRIMSQDTTFPHKSTHCFTSSQMAAFSAVRNRRNQKLREGFENFLARCIENSGGRREVELDVVLNMFDENDVTIEQKELTILERLGGKNRKISRQDLCNFAKGSKAVKTLVEKQNKISSRPGSRPGSRPASRPGSRQGSRSSTPVRNEKNMKIDKALAAFKALDKDNSGFLDREEFLNFASNMPSAHRVKLLKSLDTDGDGRIDLEEFRQLFKK